MILAILSGIILTITYQLSERIALLVSYRTIMIMIKRLQNVFFHVLPIYNEYRKTIHNKCRKNLFQPNSRSYFNHISEKSFDNFHHPTFSFYSIAYLSKSVKF